MILYELLVRRSHYHNGDRKPATEIGYDVTSVVDTGEKAIEQVKVDNPDLILMDIRFNGELDVTGAASQIRDHSKSQPLALFQSKRLYVKWIF